jgi:hypothetical protein
MSDAFMESLRAQSRLMDRVFDSIAKPARRAAAAPETCPAMPDLPMLIDELAGNLEEVAKILEPGYPATAQMLIVKARAARADAAKARAFGHAA